MFDEEKTGKVVIKQVFAGTPSARSGRVRDHGGIAATHACMRAQASHFSAKGIYMNG
jgi:hypothetical protein